MSPLFSHLSEDFSERRPLPAVSCTDRSFRHNKLFFVSTCPPQIDRELCNTRCPQRVGRSSSGRGERCAYVRDTSETIILETFECRVLRVHVLAKRRRYATIKCTRRAVLRIRYINERRVIRTLRSISSRLKVNPPRALAGRRMSPLFSHLSEDFSERRPLPAVSCTDRSFSEKVPTVRCNTCSSFHAVAS
ncbi:hypothetical protein EVAR_3184_1 [Eumeta japonica]|uniref:Uncharacterized protein n=1 Tax=Eumeta variegata TaxID=151549 RepID=A0A4C1XHM4_EUMVA|nr:hypothetical protein EVAR_3184_1 [Eumeta japonica]